LVAGAAHDAVKDRVALVGWLDINSDRVAGGIYRCCVNLAGVGETHGDGRLLLAGRRRPRRAVPVSKDLHGARGQVCELKRGAGGKAPECDAPPRSGLPTKKQTLVASEQSLGDVVTSPVDDDRDRRALDAASRSSWGTVRTGRWA
jgi:hypothetical protein